jgi:phosphoribosyl-ATP pyrophosphohydrolase
MTFALTDLDARIAERASASPEESYTARLLGRGVRKCAQKFGEEAVEAVVAATASDKPELTAEAADVLYHLLVLLRASGVPLADVMAELERRTAQSGLEEKAARGGGA